VKFGGQPARAVRVGIEVRAVENVRPAREDGVERRLESVVEGDRGFTIDAAVTSRGSAKTSCEVVK